MAKCRHCGSAELHKEWVVKGKQRYKCKRITIENDQRYKYSLSKRLKGYL